MKTKLCVLKSLFYRFALSNASNDLLKYIPLSWLWSFKLTVLQLVSNEKWWLDRLCQRWS